jgi:hypothetical protein
MTDIRSNAGFIHALCGPGPTLAHADKLMTYGRLVGDWEAEGQAIQPDGTSRRHWWHIHFAWVLEGRAIQDLWITPVRHGPKLGLSEPRGTYSDQYGMTLRIYDPERDCWDVTWLDPITRFSASLTGRAQADGSIVQEGLGSNGMGLRWTFSEVREDSFRWHSEVSQDQGKSWHLGLELQARRLK